MEDEDDERQQNNQKQKGLIKIPSYQEVFQSSQPKPPPPLFQPSSSFSQAFSFLKSSEFYTPPPPPPPPDNASRQVAQSSASASASASTTSSSSSPYPSTQSRNAILVSHRQKGNPLLKHIRNVRWMFADVLCDYLLGQGSCALYLSLRYHLLHPDYLYFRIRELQKNFKLRVVLCHVDVEDVVKPLLEVTRTALLHDCTLLCGWSLEECGRYLETIKVYENKPADSIQERMDTDYLSRLTHALTAVRHVNKTDVVTLGSTFGSLSHIMDASMEDLARCPGIGERKVKRLYDTFHEPFRRVVSKPTIVQDASIQEKAEPSSVGDNGSMGSAEKEAAASKHGKEPIITVKSALAAAFAKYSEKVGKQDADGERWQN
ncbi:DNA excision repair protein ERCC-1 isoform X1 [Cinnamomum micranthum f. kanehirae]|uniref:DNA excision repair protein ERCC-1 n=1 Tax=Cinnamomum micranthum f. kanehirae TaxID=337451 RepID=A0A3S4NRY1_9MAGN|nr:DNA excision repair protein ERCC-1 isoform X1 [Cinnamomum micranthum f. kanehirae]